MRVRPFKFEPSLPTVDAYVKRDDQNSCTVYLKPRADDRIIVHELMHVIHNICEDRYISFTNEREHTAYLYQYLFNRLHGMTYVKPKRKK